MSESIRIAPTDAEFRGLLDKARELFAEAMVLGHSEPDSEKQQAAHFAMTAILNVAGLNEHESASVLAALVGTACAEFEEPAIAMRAIERWSKDFLSDALSREKIGPRQ